MSDERTKEPQYQRGLEMYREAAETLGPMTTQVWQDDPRRLTFVLARYKFVAKMLSGKRRVLEVGCADAFGTRIVQQEVGSVVAIDFDPVFIKDVQNRMRQPGRSSAGSTTCSTDRSCRRSRPHTRST